MMGANTFSQHSSHDWQYFSYLAGQRHSQLCTHAVQTFEDTFLPVGLCKRTHTSGFRYCVTNNWLVWSVYLSDKNTSFIEVEKEKVKSEGDKRRQTDLCLPHVGQRLFEMLWRSRGMARRKLAGKTKHKNGDKECNSTIEVIKKIYKNAKVFFLKDWQLWWTEANKDNNKQQTTKLQKIRLLKRSTVKQKANKMSPLVPCTCNWWVRTHQHKM